MNVYVVEKLKINFWKDLQKFEYYVFDGVYSSYEKAIANSDIPEGYSNHSDPNTFPVYYYNTTGDKTVFKIHRYRLDEVQE